MTTADRNRLARQLHNATAGSWRTYDRTKQLTCLSWIDRMIEAKVSNGREVAVAILNFQSPTAIANRQAAYDQGGNLIRKDADNIFAAFAASPFYS